MIAVEHLFLWFLLYSCVGWIYESILVSILEKHWVNRGFLNGPVCPIYGAGAALGILLLSGLKGHPVLIFLISALGASVLEYITSWAMEKMFHARWWDYSDYRFNIQGRVSLLGAVVFGAAGIGLIEFAQPWVGGVDQAHSIEYAARGLSGVPGAHRDGYDRHGQGHGELQRKPAEFQRTGSSHGGTCRRIVAVGQGCAAAEDP